jgi:hypothetical protein
MPVVTVSCYIRDLLNGIQPPGDTGITGPLLAQITPYDPDESGIARAYVWAATGPESRLAFPRNTGTNTPAAWKQIRHDMKIFLTWFDDTDTDPNVDVNFPLLIDFVMDVLRTSKNSVQVTDPETGQVSNLVDVGENMTYEYVPPMSLEDQRYLRFDCLITAPVLELFQS